MNYKQKYEEALEKARQIHNANRVTGIEIVTCENIFPELRESEDERIRKAILHLVQHSGIATYDGINWLDMVAWLEKQGNQKQGYDQKYIADVFEQVGLAKIVRELANDNLTNALQYAMIELSKKQGEKPVEQDTEIHDLWVYIREWNEKFGRLPKDEDELVACIDYVVKRQKPAEWSEEDEKMVEDIIEAIDTQYAVSDYSKMASWLQSIKPNHWKPSKEQITAIKYFIDFHRPQANASTEGWSEFKHLESLYNDLLKL